MSAKFTPGPWSRDKYGHVIDAHGESILLRSVSIACSGKMVDEAEKNTNLIAAAPELLEACKRMMLWFEVEDDHSKMPEFMHRVDLCNQVEMLASAAIAKATGDPQC